MSTIADALKQEIARVARKELKGEIAAIRKLTSGHRSEIAALKRDIKALVDEQRRTNRLLQAILYGGLGFLLGLLAMQLLVRVQIW